MTNDIRKRNAMTALKWALYFVMLFVCYCLQTFPHLFAVANGIKPSLILPLCVAVAIYEGEFGGALFGLIGGTMWDIASGRIAGLFGIILLVLCFTIGVMIKLILKANTFNCFILSFASMLVLTGFDFIFGYLIFGYSGAGVYYWGYIFPIVVYTAAVSPALYWPVTKIYKRLTWTD